MAVPVSIIRAANKEVTGTRSIQHGRSVEGKNPTLAFRCRVNGCGELGYLWYIFVDCGFQIVAMQQ